MSDATSTHDMLSITLEFINITGQKPRKTFDLMDRHGRCARRRWPRRFMPPDRYSSLFLIKASVDHIDLLQDHLLFMIIECDLELIEEPQSPK